MKQKTEAPPETYRVLNLLGYTIGKKLTEEKAKELVRTFNKTWLLSVVNEVSGETWKGDKFLAAGANISI